MKLQYVSTCISLIATSAIALSIEPAHAFNFNNGTDLGACGALVDNLVPFPGTPASLDPTLLKNCTTADGFTLTASQPGSGFLQGKEVNDYVGVGITANNAPSRGEVQKGELLTVALDVASEIASIDLAFMYLPPLFDDKVFEKALITANGNVTGTLTVTGPTSATWSLGGTVINLSPSAIDGGGAYRINNPFADLVVSTLSFTAPSQGFRAPNDSDYALAGITKDGVSDVPEPTTLLGLGVVGGLMFAARRKKSV